jgi:hypothetical protein
LTLDTVNFSPCTTPLAARSIPMESNQMNAAGGRSFRLGPHPIARAITGVTAALAIGGFGALVFGPMADDQRALDVATLSAVGAPVHSSAGPRVVAARQEAASAVAARSPWERSERGRTVSASFAVAGAGAFAGLR